MGLGWRLASSGISLPNNVFSWLSSISRAHFRDRKTLRKRVHHKGPPLLALRLVRMQQVSTRCQHQNAGLKMRPFSEPSGNMPMLRGTKNGFEFRTLQGRPLVVHTFSKGFSVSKMGP